MRKTILAALAAGLLGAIPMADPAKAGSGNYYVVAGVEADDMLKLRAGPGIGYRVIVGLPNGAVLRLYRCVQTGGTHWCKVSLKQSRGLKGYVSWAYLREN